MTATVTVVSPSGSSAATVELPAEIFEAKVNVPLIHQVVVAQQAAARQGTHAARNRGAVRGGGKKPYRQKGTGRARQGSIRAPQFAGGGTVHAVDSDKNLLLIKGAVPGPTGGLVVVRSAAREGN